MASNGGPDKPGGSTSTTELAYAVGWQPVVACAFLRSWRRWPIARLLGSSS
jgi:hypothetical protein